MSLNLKLVLLLFFVTPQIIKAGALDNIVNTQIDSQDCLKKNMLHQAFDHAMAEQDSLEAIRHFEAMLATGCYLENWLHYRASELYYFASNLESSKLHLMTAVENGFLNALISEKEEKEYLELWTKQFGEEFCKRLIGISIGQQDKMVGQSYELITELLEIFSVDQGLRKNKFFNRTKRVGTI